MIKKKKITPIVVKNTYPVRINKYLAHKGLATRTGVDELIKSSKILINGVVAKLGDKVLETDKIVVRGTHNKKKYVYFAYNKPKGVVSTNPQRDEKGIMESVKVPEKVFPIGRLDKESHGLIILTNDGRITDRLLNPIYDHEKEYVVEVDRKFTPGFLRNMQGGVDIGEAVTKPAIVSKIEENIFSITLTEGRNRQIRRMTEKLGYTVRDLQRIRIQNIELSNTPLNSYREIKDEELNEFLKSIKLV
ncbi:MAG: rRNA pseudouridine synthase [Candidatus Zambryskibacteria bacterium]|nr:rRNA pseudouridine synthase [Candidatus Zambryskibacteria bacterium]